MSNANNDMRVMSLHHNNVSQLKYEIQHCFIFMWRIGILILRTHVICKVSLAVCIVKWWKRCGFVKFQEMLLWQIFVSTLNFMIVAFRLVPLSISACTRECSLLKTGLILLLQCGGRLLLCGQKIRSYTTHFLCNTQLYPTCHFWYHSCRGLVWEQVIRDWFLWKSLL